MGVSLTSRRPGGRGLVSARRRPRVVDGYRRLLVPVADNRESEEAIDVAARLAAEHGSSITAIAVVEVPPFLPVDAHMGQEEGLAHAVLNRAAAIAESYGVTVSLETIQARDAAAAIVDQVLARHVELVVLGAPRRPRAHRSVAIFGSTVEHVLKKSPCRVMIVGAGTRAQPAA